VPVRNGRKQGRLAGDNWLVLAVFERRASATLRLQSVSTYPPKSVAAACHLTATDCRRERARQGKLAPFVRALRVNPLWNSRYPALAPFVGAQKYY